MRGSSNTTPSGWLITTTRVPIITISKL
jgi:hypothetical protein